MARICLAPSPQEKNLVEVQRWGERSRPRVSLLVAVRDCERPLLGLGAGQAVCLLPATRRCVMSAGAARRLRWRHRAPSSLLLLFVAVVVVLPLLIPMTQGRHQEPAHAGEDPHTKQSPPVDGGEHAEEQQQLNRLGSRPPSCKSRCGRCAPCMPVEVRFANYEPAIWWMCKCGGLLFNP